MPTRRSVLLRVRRKHFRNWLGGYARHVWESTRTQRVEGPRHLLFAVCDHFEPEWRNAKGKVARDRVQGWIDAYPALADEFRDADGRPPRHSFFFPAEQYAPQYLELLASMARRGYGEVELHLHHEDDTADNLRATIAEAIERFASHGHLARDADGRSRYAFIHGNWCLANARSDGEMCGVDAEIPLLWESGCYADFTFPSAPDESQPNIVNQIYWPTGVLSRRRAYESGERARVGAPKDDRLLMIQGPLALAREPGRIARIESGDLHGGDPPNAGRVRTWVRQNIHVQGRPEWVFVKVHTHGAVEENAISLLNDGGRALHRALAAQYNNAKDWVLHYVTAREMFNIALAAVDGRNGNPDDYRNYRLPPPPVASP